MYICLCTATTEQQIRQATHNGARSLQDLHDALGVASQCGQCASSAIECINETLDEMQVKAEFYAAC